MTWRLQQLQKNGPVGSGGRDFKVENWIHEFAFENGLCLVFLHFFSSYRNPAPPQYPKSEPFSVKTKNFTMMNEKSITILIVIATYQTNQSHNNSDFSRHEKEFGYCQFLGGLLCCCCLRIWMHFRCISNERIFFIPINLESQWHCFPSRLCHFSMSLHGMPDGPFIMAIFEMLLM